MTGRSTLLSIVLCAAAILAAAGRPTSTGDAAPSTDLPVPRRPVAAVFLEDGKTLAVANSRAGSVSLLDVDSGRVLNEVRVGRQLSDLQPIAGTSLLLATDDLDDQLLLLRVEKQRLEVLHRTPVCRGAVSLTVTADGKVAAVAGLWSHQLDVMDLSDCVTSQGAPKQLRSIELPVAPRCQHWLPGGLLAVADSFAGRLAIVDIAKAKVVATHDFPGHNIRGMTITPDGKSLCLAHQILDQKALINWQTVHSGTLMANIVRRVPLDRLDDPSWNLDAGSEKIPVGMTGHGGGDPTGLAFVDDGAMAVCLSGVSQVEVVNRFQVITDRIDVGRRPTQLIRRPGSEQLLSVNTLGDSATLIDPKSGRVVREMSLGSTRPLKRSERGELAFYDARLSHDGWLSCHSCHTDGHTNGLRADTAADGTDGAPKRVLTLRGVAHTDRWSWNGKSEELFDQVRNSMLTTMLSDGVDGQTAQDLVDYIESLPPVPAREAARNAEDGDQIARGRRVFLDHACQQCHVPPQTYTSSDSYDVGLRDERGMKRFNPPSLRGVGHASRFFHDNRATSLESVFRDHAHPGETNLTDVELADLVRFLRSL